MRTSRGRHWRSFAERLERQVKRIVGSNLDWLEALLGCKPCAVSSGLLFGQALGQTAFDATTIGGGVVSNSDSHLWKSLPIRERTSKYWCANPLKSPVQPHQTANP